MNPSLFQLELKRTADQEKIRNPTLFAPIDRLKNQTSSQLLGWTAGQC